GAQKGYGSAWAIAGDGSRKRRILNTCRGPNVPDVAPGSAVIVGDGCQGMSIRPMPTHINSIVRTHAHSRITVSGSAARNRMHCPCGSVVAGNNHAYISIAVLIRDIGCAI